MNIVFMGTPEFAVPTLNSMIENYNVIAVFTQPDKPKGRGKKMAFSEVKEAALLHDIPVFQPDKIRNNLECLNYLKDLQPDIIIVVAYGQILPKEILDLPKYGCINLHASILPKYRGAAPINWCIINGEKVSGNTTMLMDVGLDTGDILLQSEVKITENMTAGQLHDILMIDGAELMVKTINNMKDNNISPIPQDDSKSCYSPMLSKDKAVIDWSKPSEEINNFIRGLNPWPIAHTTMKNESMKIFKASVVKKESNKAYGTILNVSKEGILVSTAKDCLLIQEIQFSNGKRMTVEQYINGNTIDEGVILG